VRLLRLGGMVAGMGVAGVVGLGALTVVQTPIATTASSCATSGYDNSPGCTQASLDQLNQGRASEGLAPESLPADWYGLSPAQQLLVATNSERTVRGLAALTENSSLDGDAAQGASSGTDPSPSQNYQSWGSNWAGDYQNALEAAYAWVYNDGPGSPNVDCTPSNPAGCNGHRKNVLGDYTEIGTAYTPGSWAEIMSAPYPPSPPAAIVPQSTTTVVCGAHQ